MDLEEALALITTQKASIATLEGAIERTNKEAESHRLNADAFQQQADSLRKQVESLTGERDTAVSKGAEENERLKLDLTAQLSAANTARDNAVTGAKAKITDVELRAVAREMGVADLDYLKLLDRTNLKTDDDGNPTNAGEVLDAWKVAKPHLLGAPVVPGTKSGTTGTTQPVPAPKPSAAPDVRKMSDKEYDAALAGFKAGGFRS